MLIKRRVRRLAILLICLYLIPVLQLWYYQVWAADALLRRPENARGHEDLSLRGSILDRRGRPLAVTSAGRRRYPLGPAAAPLLGYLSARLGSAGLEGALQGDLAGRPRPRTFDEARRLAREGDRRGDDVVLTLDADLQRTAYDLLQGERGAILLLDVPTGEVLAAAGRPSFEPASLESQWDRLRTDRAAPLVDRATQGLYPPGSSFKILTLAAALGEGKAAPDEAFSCTGSLPVAGFVLHDDGGASHGTLGLTTAFARSCN
ncbi:MAG: penicillin-binding transpeptidase domain-containing protein, partial [Candidatus Eremiobacterota bacterium]